MTVDERPPVTDARTADEMRRAGYDPWLPAETWLVAGSLGLGLLLLGLLLWATGRI